MEGRDEMGWLTHMFEEARRRAQSLGYSLPAFDEFWAEGVYEFPSIERCEPFLGAFRQDPDKNPLSTRSGKIEIFSHSIAQFGYHDCPPHPEWLEPAEWLGSSKTSRFPLHLLSNQPSVRLHSQLDSAKCSRASKICEREPLRMSREDAKARNLKSGQTVRVFNDRGAFIAGLDVVDFLMPGVVQIATGAWFDPFEPGVPGSLEKHGNPNVVTDDKGTSSLSQMSVAQTVLVEVEAAVDPPASTAFERPPIMDRSC
jgi:biotin/methionine sulfoxide reductase